MLCLLAPGAARLAGAELARVSQAALNIHCEGMRATKHAPRGPFNLLERRHGLAAIVERGVGVKVERMRVKPKRKRPRAADFFDEPKKKKRPHARSRKRIARRKAHAAAARIIQRAWRASRSRPSTPRTAPGSAA